jgi:hypothetical protein
MEDASRDRDALEGVRAVKRWGARPREITKGDGIEHLKRDLGRKELTEYGPESGYPTFSMLSELGAHPGALGHLLFSLRPDSRFVLRTIDYNLGQALPARACWYSASVVPLGDVRSRCETPRMGRLAHGGNPADLRRRRSPDDGGQAAPSGCRLTHVSHSGRLSRAPIAWHSQVHLPMSAQRGHGRGPRPCPRAGAEQRGDREGLRNTAFPP